MDYAKYNRSLLDILQVLAKNPELKNVPDLEDWVDMGEMTYRSSPSTNMIYKKSGPRLASYAPRIFQRDMTLLTGKDAEWPEMFSSWIPKVASMPQKDQDYIWGKLADALVAIGQRPNSAPAAVKQQQQPQPPKEATHQKQPATEEERRHMQFKQVIRENPELRTTVRAVRNYVKNKSGGGGGSKDGPGPEFDALMAQLKTGSTTVESELTKVGMPQGFLQSNAGIFSRLTGLLKKMADSEDQPEDAIPASGTENPIKEKEDEETRKIMDSLSMVQQFHVKFLEYFHGFAQFRGGRFPQLAQKYGQLRSYLQGITKVAPAEYTLLNEVVQFMKDNRKAIKHHDPKLFEEPTYPLFKELNTPAIWKSLDKEEYRSQFWNWVEEVRNISLAAHICTGDTAPFETIAKSVLPSICSSIKNSGAEGTEGMMDRFMDAMQEPARIRSLKGLIDNFSKDPSQVTKAVDLITTMLDDGEESEPEEGTTTNDSTSNTATLPTRDSSDIPIG